MHDAVVNFVKGVRARYPESFEAVRVLDAGSLDINGSNRAFFNQQSTYIGVDVGPGIGVDIVKPLRDISPEELPSIDTIISTEMLEHDETWQDSLQRMVTLLRPGGLLIFTCAGEGRGEHGTARTTPNDSPWTNEWYRNLSKSDVHQWLRPALYFDPFSLGQVGTDLQFFGIRNSIRYGGEDDVALP